MSRRIADPKSMPTTAYDRVLGLTFPIRRGGASGLISCDASSVNAAESMRFIQQAQRELGLKELSLRCDCENLETVYVVDRSGQLVVTDRGHTFQHLDLSGDQTYGPMDVQLARAICHRHGAELDDHDPELYPQVIRVVAHRPLRDAIDAVAGAVEELFSTATDKQRQPGGPLRD